MDYIKRAIEPILQQSGQTFKSVLVTGPRQVGKTTVLKETFAGTSHVTFDDQILRKNAILDPALFIRDNPPPLIIDEVQYVPEIFPEIKRICDSNKEYGRYYITGSQKYHLMENVTESLAGRIAIHELQGLSMREIKTVDFNRHFVPTNEYFAERKAVLSKYDDIWQRIHRGFNPELQFPDMDWQTYWSSYVQTYMERDVSKMINVKDKTAFTTFLTAMAARTGQLLNYSAIADEVGKTVATIKDWTSVLQASGLIFLLQPYSSSALKRAIKTPKVYFRDTGLACYLTRWLTPETLRASAMNGNMFETFVVSEILKSFSNAGEDHRFSVFYYRGRDKKRVRRNGVTETYGSEIDMIIHENGTLYPIEIKMSSNPDASMAGAFDVLDLDSTKVRGKGAIICLYENLVSLREDLVAVPIEYI
ncbi:MAG: ATP-binding protein [Candidatus Methanoplasma sp.]|jgi:predicted AAA+ superfamily ATPase|nr:ATP-binding protein [Candidatus Methanoplasma sp.]